MNIRQLNDANTMIRKYTRHVVLVNSDMILGTFATRCETALEMEKFEWTGLSRKAGKFNRF